MEDLECELLAEFECPICVSFMYPPIRQCTNGHTFCNGCFARIEHCPQCRAKKGVSRCFAMEKIFNIVTFPCKFDGCQYLAPGMSIRQHEEQCAYFPIGCPLNVSYECRWTGPLPQMAKHCVQAHAANYFISPSQKLKVTRFKEKLKNRLYHIVFFVYGKVFRFTWELLQFTSITGTVRLAVYEISRKTNNDERFDYMIHFTNYPKGKSITLGATCPSMLKTEDVFVNNSKCLSVPYATLCELCDEKGDLMYKIEIIDKRNEGVLTRQRRTGKNISSSCKPQRSRSLDSLQL